MLDILYNATILLNFAAILFAAIFIFINISSKYSDVTTRSESILKITKTSVWLSMLFAFLSCLLVNETEVVGAIAKAASLYKTISISWMIIMLICGIGMLFCFLSKKAYKITSINSLKSIFKMAVITTIISMVMTWLLS